MNLYVHCWMKRAVKHILTGICALALAACIVMAFTAGAGARRSIRCTGLEVVVLDSMQNSFVSAKDVKGYIDREYGSYIGQAIDSIDLVRVEDIIDGGCRVVRFRVDRAVCETVYEALHKLGSMPLPPYITEHLENPERYQTVYARHEGSAAAPTAGLHFTPELMDRIRAMGCAIVPVLLHVGLGTFRPVKEEKLADHEMHSEYICVTEESARIINERRAAGGRVIAIGTTSCRVLESAADESGILHPISADTGIFIYPGYRFKMVDALLTNFHLPKSTLLMLVSALGGRERMLSAYRTAVEMEYRFFSFGDAMLIQ